MCVCVCVSVCVYMYILDQGEEVGVWGFKWKEGNPQGTKKS